MMICRSPEATSRTSRSSGTRAQAPAVTVVSTTAMCPLDPTRVPAGSKVAGRSRRGVHRAEVHVGGQTAIMSDLSAKLDKALIPYLIVVVGLAFLIMIAVFIGFEFAGMPLVAQLGVACAVAIAVDATVVRLVLVPALMAMFDEWNWWLPRWLDRVLPSVDFEKPLPKADIGDLIIIPDDISALAP